MPRVNGPNRTRTCDLVVISDALCQLSYEPAYKSLTGTALPDHAGGSSDAECDGKAALRLSPDCHS